MPEAQAHMLPPPAAALLDYAAYGWSVHMRHLTKGGHPRLPAADRWLPALAALLAAADGPVQLERLALLGMHAWNVDPSISAVVPAAFATPDIMDRLAALYPGPLPGIPASLMAPPAPAPHPVAALPAPTPAEAVPHAKIKGTPTPLKRISAQP